MPRRVTPYGTGCKDENSGGDSPFFQKSCFPDFKKVKTMSLLMFYEIVPDFRG
jgi:hypothetical protein